MSEMEFGLVYKSKYQEQLQKTRALKSALDTLEQRYKLAVNVESQREEELVRLRKNNRQLLAELQALVPNIEAKNKEVLDLHRENRTLRQKIKQQFKESQILQQRIENERLAGQLERTKKQVGRLVEQSRGIKQSYDERIERMLQQANQQRASNLKLLEQLGSLQQKIQENRSRAEKEKEKAVVTTWQFIGSQKTQFEEGAARESERGKENDELEQLREEVKRHQKQNSQNQKLVRLLRQQLDEVQREVLKIREQNEANLDSLLKSLKAEQGETNTKLREAIKEKDSALAALQVEVLTLSTENDNLKTNAELLGFKLISREKECTQLAAELLHLRRLDLLGLQASCSEQEKKNVRISQLELEVQELQYKLCISEACSSELTDRVRSLQAEIDEWSLKLQRLEEVRQREREVDDEMAKHQIMRRSSRAPLRNRTQVRENGPNECLPSATS